ncbi:hypothetical protein SLS54_005008 [Diplodia seriata]
MKNCFQDCILGDTFLKKTETLGRHLARRVRQKLVSTSRLLRFNIVDGPQERLMGSLNGRSIGALADTGANVNVMSRSTAMQLGLKIFHQKQHKTRLAFVDGSVASTSGMVFGVEWKFGNDDASPGHLLDFHILDQLPCRVVLGEDILYDNNVFSRYQDYFYDEASSAYGGEKIDILGLIIDVGKGEDWGVSVMDEEELQELHRRSSVEDEIAALPIAEQDLRFEPQGSPMIGIELRGRILKPFVFVVFDRGGTLKRALLIIVITDGIPHDESQEEFKRTIIKCIKALEQRGHQPEGCIQRILYPMTRSPVWAKVPLTGIGRVAIHEKSRIAGNNNAEGALVFFQQPDGSVRSIFYDDETKEWVESDCVPERAQAAHPGTTLCVMELEDVLGVFYLT